MTLLILHPAPAQAVPCNAPRCPYGARWHPSALSGGLTLASRPRTHLKAPAGLWRMTTGEA